MAPHVVVGRLVQSENREECAVHAPLFFWCEMSGQITEPVDIDRTKLFDKNTSRYPIDLDLTSGIVGPFREAGVRE